MMLHSIRTGVAVALIFFGTALGGSPAEAQASESPFTVAQRYDVAGRVTGTIAPDPDGTGPLRLAATRNTYDGAGRLIRTEAGELSTWASESVAPANWTGFTVTAKTEIAYDAASRKVREEHWGGGVRHSVVQYSYDHEGRPLCTARRMNPSTFGSPPSDACALGTQGNYGPDRISKKVYDAAGQLKSEIRALGVPLLQQTYVAYDYSPNGQVTAVTDANGNKAVIFYDAYDRKSRWNFPSAMNAQVGQTNFGDYEEYGYDANGNRTSLRKRDGATITYQYDALNRMTAKIVPERPNLSAAQTRDVHYAYDLRGLQTGARFDSQSGEGVSTSYDGFGRPSSSSLTMDGVTRTISYEYDAGGNRTRVTLPDNNYTTYDYDGLNRVSAIRENGGTAIATISYDSGGRRWNTAYSGALTTYGYDSVSRLASLNHDLAGSAADYSLSFTYTPASQIDTRVSANDSYAWTGAYNVSRTYAPNGLNQYWSAGPANFAYDANGNLTGDGASAYVYDVENRLLSGSGATPATLVYDPLGRLYQTSGGSAGTTRFLYDGDELVAEYSSSNVMLRRYVHGAGTDDPMFSYEGATLADRWILFGDHQGSIVAITNATGNRIGTNTYDPWGIPGTGNGGRFAYTGQIRIPELGMYHYKARVYSPTLGRFLQTDPIGYDDQINLYAYVGNDPLNKTDPSGTRQCVRRKGGGVTCTYEYRASPVVAAVVSVGAALWNAGVHLYEGATGTGESNSRSQARATADESSKRTPIYHRLESATQTPRDAARQERTGVMGGYPARGSDIPTVKAYSGPLPAGARGIEFTTAVPPAKGSVPGQPKWYPGQPGVGLIPGEKGPMAAIPVTILRNTQRREEFDE